jgi:hypothetical protein
MNTSYDYGYDERMGIDDSSYLYPYSLLLQAFIHEEISFG